MGAMSTGHANNMVLSAGKFDPDGDGLVGLKNLFTQIGSEQPQRLVIHFHGGLVSREGGERDADDLSRQYALAGAKSLFVIWETSWLEVTSQKLPKIVQEDIFKRILRRVTQFVKGKLDKELGPEGAKGIDDELTLPFEQDVQEEIDRGKAGEQMFSHLPVDRLSSEIASRPDESSLSAVERQQIQVEIENDTQLQDQVLSIAQSHEPATEARGKGEEVTPVTSLIDEEKLNEIAPLQTVPGAPAPKAILSTIKLGKSVAVIVGAVIWRFAKKRDHGPYLTIVEEIMREFYVRAAGRFLWQGMKDEVDGAFQSGANCGGTALVTSLDEMWQAGIKPQVTLVGHSAGSIYIARLLKELNDKLPGDFKVNVILIAPACTFKILADSLKGAGKRVDGLRIFGMGDPVERKDAIVPLVYPASLLYFVSGVLEDDRDEPLVGMQRYYGGSYADAGFDDIASVRTFNHLKRDHAFAWALASGANGANCDMKSHGGWVSADQTLQSVLYIIKNGYGYA
jgi:hypothetical protein